MAVGSKALAVHLQMMVKGEYDAYIDRELNVGTALLDLMLQAWQLGFVEIVKKC
jgi:hypothetical protein